MKRIVCALCVLAMLAAMCPFVAAAGGSAAPKVAVCVTDDNGNDLSAVGLNKGDTFWVEFRLENYDGAIGDYTDEWVYDKVISCIILDLNYDSAKVAPVSNGGALAWDTPYTNIHTGGSFRTAETADGMRLLLQTDGSGGQDFCIDKSTLDLQGGVLFAVQFTVTADTDGLVDGRASLSLAAESVCGITVNSRQENASLVTVENVSGLTYGSAGVALGTVGGTPTYVVGDLDDDGEVTDWDGVLMARYLAGWNVQIADDSVLDIDGDGEVTDWDGVVLDRYLAGWGVTIG